MSETPQIEQLRILVAEDEAMNQEYIKALLDCCNAVYQIVNNGREALEALEKSDFDLLFLDCQMPVLDGWATIKQIRENEKLTGKHLPVFALTGSALRGDESLFKSAGMDGFMLKPPTVADIRALFGKLRDGLYAADSNSKNLPVQNDESLSAKSCIDHNFIKNKYAEMPELLKNLAAIFAESGPDISNRLKQAIISQNSKDTLFYAHKLKGMCANFGKSDLWHFLNQLENDFTSTPPKLDLSLSLELKFTLFKKEIETLI